MERDRLCMQLEMALLEAAAAAGTRERTTGAALGSAKRSASCSFLFVSA